jgi:hypothetical protein
VSRSAAGFASANATASDEIRRRNRKKKELSSDAFQQLLVPKKKLGAGIIIA